MHLRMPAIIQSLCIHWTCLLTICGLLTFVNSHADLGLNSDNEGQDSVSLLKLRLIEDRLEKRTIQDASHLDDNENPDSQTGQFVLELLRRHQRQSTEPIDNFIECYVSFINTLKPIASVLPQKLIAGAPEVLYGLQKIPNLLPVDDISFITRDTNNMIIKFRIVFDVMLVVKAKLGAFIKPEFIAWWNKESDMLIFKVKLANFATARLLFNKEEQIEIMSAGISGVNLSVQYGMDRSAITAVYNAAQYLVGTDG